MSFSEDTQELQAKGGQFDFDKLKFVFRKSLPWMVIIFVCSLVGAYMYLRWTQPSYQANTLIQMEVQSAAHMMQYDVLMGAPEAQANISKEIELLKSDIMYKAVLDSINLTVNYYQKGEILDTEIFNTSPFTVEHKVSDRELYGRTFTLRMLNPAEYELEYEYKGQPMIFKHAFGYPLKLEGAEFTIKLLYFDDSYISQEYLFTIQDEASLLNTLRDNFSVSVDNKTANTLSLSYTAHNPEKATAILRAFNRNYVVKSIENKDISLAKVLRYLEQQQGILRDSLDKYESLFRNYVNLDNIPTSQDGVQSVVQNIRLLEKDNNELQTLRQTLSHIRQLIRADSSMVYVEAFTSMLKNTQIDGIVAKLRELEIAHDMIKGSYTDKTAAYSQQRNVLRNGKQRLLEILQVSEDRLSQGLSVNNGEIDRMRKAFYQGIGGDPLLKKYTKGIETFEGMLNSLSSKIVDINMSKASTVENFRVLSPPFSSPEPISPKSGLAYGLAIVLSFMSSIILVSVRYVLQNKISNLKQLENNAQVPILGMVPAFEKERMEHSQLVVHRNPKSSISEAFRSLRTNLDFVSTAIDKDARILSITSTISGEGKTFVAVNLAGVIAMSGARVVLLDLDLRKPKIHLAFNVDNAKGVSSILAHKAELSECIKDSDLPSLKVITSGPIPPNPSELLLSKHFEELLDTLSEEFDIIVFDTPPVGLVTDGIIAMKRSTMPIYVIRAEYSKLIFVQNANNLAHVNKFHNLSVVLNGVPLNQRYGNSYSFTSYGYGASYGYGGQGYYDEEQTRADKRPWWKRWSKKADAESTEKV